MLHQQTINLASAAEDHLMGTNITFRFSEYDLQVVFSYSQ
jgi:hypothetical protein